MNIALFGATGRTGRPLVQQALAAGHGVTALVRDPAKVTVRHERLTLVQGDVHDAARVREVVAGGDAVISVLGLTRGGPKDVVSVGVRHMLAAMRERDLKRIVVLTGAGVKVEGDEASLGATVMTSLLKLVAGPVLVDAVQAYHALQESDRDWVLVRGPRLTEGPHTGVYRTGSLRLGPGATISRADVADFMLKELSDDTYRRGTPMVSY